MGDLKAGLRKLDELRDLWYDQDRSDRYGVLSDFEAILRAYHDGKDPDFEVGPAEPEFKVGDWVITDWLVEPLRQIVEIEPKYLTLDSGHTARIGGPVRLATPKEMFRPGALVECLCQNGTTIRGRVRGFSRQTCGDFEILFEDLAPRDSDFNRFTLLQAFEENP